MDNRKQEKRRKILARIKDFCLMDDEFMTRFFEGELDCTSYVLQVILGNPSIRATEAVSQKNIPNLKGRSVRLDIRATDDTGRLYDIEIQRADKGAGARRARYNSALMDANESVPGYGAEELPETYVIFITENDVWGEGLPMYHIDRTVRELGRDFGDGAHIIYVNNSYRGDDPVGELMHDFACRRVSDMKSGLLANRARALKETTQGVKNMCRSMEELVQEERAEARLENSIETAAWLIGMEKITEEEAIKFFHFTPEQMAMVREEMAVLA